MNLRLSFSNNGAKIMPLVIVFVLVKEKQADKRGLHDFQISARAVSFHLQGILKDEV